jgi:hypothetical protein
MTRIGVPIVFPQGNRVIQLAKKTEIERVAAIKTGSWVKVIAENRKNQGKSTPVFILPEKNT